MIVVVLNSAVVVLCVCRIYSNDTAAGKHCC